MYFLQVYILHMCREKVVDTALILPYVYTIMGTKHWKSMYRHIQLQSTV